MSKIITNVLWVLVVLLIANTIYNHVNPTIKIETVSDTTYVSASKEVVDSITYYFEAKIDSVRKLKPKWIVDKTIHDTVNTTDTVYLSYWSMFALGDSSLGVKGKVAFDMKDFSFQDVVFNTMQDSVFVVDSVKTTITKSDPFYKDNWFYATAALFVLLIASLGG